MAGDAPQVRGGLMTIAMLLLAGCAGQDFVTPPHLQVVCVAPIWSTQQQIQAKCGTGALACADVGTTNGQIARIWAQKPSGFNTTDTCVLGHELLHNLGATH